MQVFEIATPPESRFSDPPEGVSVVRSESNYIEFAEAGRNWPIYTFRVLSTVGLGVLSNYIYDTIKHAGHEEPKTIIIDNVDVRFDRGEIHEVIRQKTTIKQ
jgi:hypothetical protein